MSGNILYTGDNLYILHGMDGETVDLIYLDPPFNSKRLYKAPVGSRAAGASFKDMWTWQDVDESYLDQLVEDYPFLVQFIQSVEVIHGKPMMAYLTYLTQRLIEMHRVLKPTGSIYLHCDPYASHYLKIIMDRVFGRDNFLNEVTWKRTTTKNDYAQGAVNWPRVHDVMLHYRASKAYKTFAQPFGPLSEDYVRKTYRKIEPETGRRYRLDNLAAPGGGTRGHPQYEFMGVTRYWRYSKDKMEDLLAAGRIVQTAPGRVPAYKRYLDESKGVAIGDIWTDIAPVLGAAKERTGYPTQKPLKLLQRIIEASSNKGDTVLDPFCGCATTCVAAQQLGRNWIGIDISEKAAELVVERLSDEAGLFTDFVHLDRPPVRTDLEQCAPDQDAKTRLYADQHGQCNACGVEMEIRHLEIDHIIPRAKHGGDYYENYQLLCGHCNRTKGDRPMEYLRAKIKRRSETLRTRVSF